MSFRLAFVPLLLMPLLLIACTVGSPRFGNIGSKTTGEASWYGHPFHGRTTASGEVFNRNALTAAHQNLPFGTMVKVTNLENGRSVVVTINDRFPGTKGRIIDLSEAAFVQLAPTTRGVIRVQLEIVGPRYGNVPTM